MLSANLLLLLVMIIAVRTFETSGKMDHCRNSSDRCVPQSYCPHIHNRTKAGEHRYNSRFKKEVLDSICQPTVKKEKFHICCSKAKIKCTVGGKPGECLTPAQCPALRHRTEAQLMASHHMLLCYKHEQVNYFCCEHEAPASIETNDLILHPNAEKLAEQQCGVNGPVLKIQNGTTALEGEFPWIVKLVYRHSALCSGTLIHPSYVLTAKHCTSSDLHSVLLGIHDLRDKPPCNRKNWEQCSHVQEIKIAVKMRHNKYDVGLLRLFQPATLDGNRVQPICLPLYTGLQMHTPHTVTIVGWGTTHENRQSDVLLQADTLVINRKCDKEYEICVGWNESRNHCAGDSGGPYQATGEFNGKYRTVQYAIISNGPRFCSQPNGPSRGLLLRSVIKWILDRMEL